MTDPLAQELAERVAAASPSAPPPFDEIRRLVRRRRVRTVAAVAGSAAVVATMATVSWTLRSSDSDSAPPVGTPSATGPATPAAPSPSPTSSLPAYTGDGRPSGLVATLPGGEVTLPADTSCWRPSEPCRRGLLLPGAELPDLGRQDAIDFSFPRAGWDFRAIFRAVGDECPRATTVDAVPTGARTFRLAPADESGSYEVELGGGGPDGGVSTRFLWTTTADGPVDPPAGSVLFAPESRGDGSYAAEVVVDDLAFHPARSELSPAAEVTVTDADGRQRTLTVPLEEQSLDCHPRGASGLFYYQMEWDQDIAALGRRPFDVAVTLTIRGTTYVGRGTWGGGGYAPLTFSPPLPAAAVD